MRPGTACFVRSRWSQGACLKPTAARQHHWPTFTPPYWPNFAPPLTGEREVLYLQKRVGRGKKTFYVIKFVTMLKNSPYLGSGAITLQNDPRVLPIGGFLRKTKLNELPQLFNILKGDMSLVGPRPLMLKQFNLYDKNVQAVISDMRPGLTGLGSIAFRDEEQFFVGGVDPDIVYRNKIAPTKALLETWFYNNRSVFIYVKLIMFTGDILIHIYLLWSLP